MLRIAGPLEVAYNMVGMTLRSHQLTKVREVLRVCNKRQCIHLRWQKETRGTDVGAVKVKGSCGVCRSLRRSALAGE
jgi:hypothetical protein